MRLSDLLKQTGSIICQTDTEEFDFTSHPMIADALVIAGVGGGSFVQPQVRRDGLRRVGLLQPWLLVSAT